MGQKNSVLTKTVNIYIVHWLLWYPIQTKTGLRKLWVQDISKGLKLVSETSSNWFSYQEVQEFEKSVQ